MVNKALVICSSAVVLAGLFIVSVMLYKNNLVERREKTCSARGLERSVAISSSDDFTICVNKEGWLYQLRLD